MESLERLLNLITKSVKVLGILLKVIEAAPPDPTVEEAIKVIVFGIYALAIPYRVKVIPLRRLPLAVSIVIELIAAVLRHVPT